MAESNREILRERLKRAAVILLAEDEPMIRWDIADRLRDAGWHVIEVATADAGFELLMSATKVDLVLTDINMPGKMDGLSLARFAASLPGVKIVLMSAVPSELIEGFENAPLHDLFIKKPYDHVTMIARIGGLLERNG
jgi:two-component system, response regulator PdtaR